MDFVYWLEALPAATVGKLYGSQWACQAVLRSLPPLAKQYVARMLFVETPIPSSKSVDLSNQRKISCTHDQCVLTTLSCRDHPAMGHCCSSKQASCSLGEAEALAAARIYIQVSHQLSCEASLDPMSRLLEVPALYGLPDDMVCPAALARSSPTACILSSSSNYKAR